MCEGARAWYFNVVGDTGSILSLPQRMPNSYTTLGYCTWYVIADLMPGYNINNSCLKEIKAFYNACKNSKNTHVKGMSEFLKAKSKAGRVNIAYILERDDEALRSILEDNHAKL